MIFDSWFLSNGSLVALEPLHLLCVCDTKLSLVTSTFSSHGFPGIIFLAGIETKVEKMSWQDMNTKCKADEAHCMKWIGIWELWEADYNLSYKGHITRLKFRTEETPFYHACKLSELKMSHGYIVTLNRVVISSISLREYCWWYKSENFPFFHFNCTLGLKNDKFWKTLLKKLQFVSKNLFLLL